MSKIKRSFTVEISEARCRSCAVCWEICEPKVLAWRPPLNKAVVKDLEACTGCRLCEWLCPDWAIVVKSTTPEIGETQAAQLSGATS
jgi:NAD-dependent dihydropyrimidine dehydrogenase PreA subunit